MLRWCTCTCAASGPTSSLCCRASAIAITLCTYRICPYRSRAQIEAGARIEAGGQDKSLIEAGPRIEAGPEQEFAVNRSRTVIDTPLDRHVCILSWLVTCLEDALSDQMDSGTA